MIDVLLAVPDLDAEAELVSSAAGCAVRVVRRCVDAVDLLAAAAADQCIAVVVTAGLPRLTADGVERLLSGRRVVGLSGTGDTGSLLALGIADVTTIGATPQATWRAVRELLEAGPRPDNSAGPPRDGVWPTGLWRSPDASANAVSRQDAVPTQDPVNHRDTVASPREGRLVAVWGPMGSPGRTTVAIGVAEALAESGRRVCLVDADTYAPSIALMLGVVDNPGGLQRAVLLAESGSLARPTLVAATRRLHGPWHLMSGLVRTDQWPELRPTGLDRLWRAARDEFDDIVVDVGFCLEDDDAPGTWARRRNAAAVSAVAAADHVLAVGDSSPLGAARLAAAWPGLAAAAQSRPVTLVGNRSRRSRDRGWTAGVRSLGVGADVHALPADPRALAACWGFGRSLAEGARRSPLRRSFVTLAQALVSG